MASARKGTAEASADRFTLTGGSAVLADGSDTAPGAAFLSSSTAKFHNFLNLQAASIKNFDSCIFELPDVKAGDVVLSLTGRNANGERSDVTGAAVDVQTIGILTGSADGEFVAGDKVCLLKNSNGMESANMLGKTVAARSGISLE